MNHPILSSPEINTETVELPNQRAARDYIQSLEGDRAVQLHYAGRGRWLVSVTRPVRRTPRRGDGQA